jgi:hypothetical protein
MQLAIAKGTNQYQAVKGSLWYQGCYESGDPGRLRAATLTRIQPASFPKACDPPDLARTLGTASQLGRTAPVADPTCPASTADGHQEGRIRWTARIAAEDPKEWLRIDSCLWTPAHGAFAGSNGPGTFIVYTANGDLTGTVAGGAIAGNGPKLAEDGPFWIFLDVTAGTGDFQFATGSLLCRGCTVHGAPVSASLTLDPGSAWEPPTCPTS